MLARTPEQTTVQFTRRDLGRLIAASVLLVAAMSVLLGELSEDVRQTLTGLDPKRWAAVRAEASRVLDTVERPELRDTAVSTMRDGIASRFAGDLSGPEIALGVALIKPLVVPNSSY